MHSELLLCRHAVSFDDKNVAPTKKSVWIFNCTESGRKSTGSSPLIVWHVWMARAWQARLTGTFEWHTWRQVWMARFKGKLDRHVWMACLACKFEWHAWHACLNGTLDRHVWMAHLTGTFEWHTWQARLNGTLGRACDYGGEYSGEITYK